MFLPRQFHVLVVQNPRERDVNAVSWSFPLYLLLINLFVLPIAFAGLLVFPEARGEADSFILRLPLHFDSHLDLGGGVPRRLLGGHRHDRGGLARAVEDDHQRRHPAHAAAAALHRGHLLDHALLHAPGHARRGRPRLPVGAAGARPAAPRGDGAAVVHRRDPVRAGHPARALLAAGEPAGRLRRHLRGLRAVVLHADHPRPRAGRLRSGARLLDAGPLGLACAPAHRAPRPRGARRDQPRGVLVALRQRRRLRARLAVHASRTPTSARRPPPSWARPAEDKTAVGAPAILSATEIERLVHHYVGEADAPAHRPRAVQRQGARRPVGARAARAAHPLRAAARRLAGRRGGPHDRRGPVHDLEGRGARAGELVPAHAAVPAAEARRRSGAASACSPRWCRAWTTASSPPTSSGRLRHDEPRRPAPGRSRRARGGPARPSATCSKATTGGARSARWPARSRRAARGAGR